MLTGEGGEVKGRKDRAVPLLPPCSVAESDTKPIDK